MVTAPASLTSIGEMNYLECSRLCFPILGWDFQFTAHSAGVKLEESLLPYAKGYIWSVSRFSRETPVDSLDSLKEVLVADVVSTHPFLQ